MADLLIKKKVNQMKKSCHKDNIKSNLLLTVIKFLK